ncbi:hypothetical protein OGR47_14385 [Methylocystis sp. MJC1]|uniref:Em GEA1 (EM1) n=1 Tax=Methylocystis sp. MJC1 TaxID=2654282 RepID=UPI0013EA50D0|nr:Em GEA1 (EM1) [Methylocystis sp. MJC1]KAF2990354.1 hypothetical protein MJC1_02453 [Methylocystis sp. MJC1]MBU6528150.1 hypothetical protein [Methylocystis sp. MJC1]UZX11062.1 hypothetical protein OGR47_14385 [Methylocystis sp. MJC1]
MPQKHTEPQKPPVRPGQMTVEEAGRLGGHKGGQRVKQLVEEGKRLEREEGGEEIKTTEQDDEEDGEA